MANLTRSGVCYNLSESPFSVEWMGMWFYFSSHTHLLKFRKLMNERASWLRESLSRRFHVRVCAGRLAVIQLYMQVERRGFRIVYKGCEFLSPDDIQLSVEWM